MTDDPPDLQPAPTTYNRRATDRHPGDTPTQRRRRLVRYLASDPLNVDWLARHNADLLERVARHIALRGDKAAAARLRSIARAHRDHEVSPF